MRNLRRDYAPEHWKAKGVQKKKYPKRWLGEVAVFVLIFGTLYGFSCKALATNSVISAGTDFSIAVKMNNRLILG